MSAKRFLGLTLAAALAVVPAACGGTDDTPSPDMETPTTAAMPAPAEMGPAEPGTIVEVAAAAGTFETLLAAAAATGLVETLESDGPFTVLAPTDDAFAKLPEGTVEALLADPEALAQILLYHVIPGEFRAAEVTQLSEAGTAQGGTVSIMVHDGAVMINDATVIATDIEASNGIIHVIDTVLIPAS
jgi:transforming growth factor-beta-induced protein